MGVEVLKNCLDELQNWENIAPNKMAPNARKRLGHVCQDMAAGLSGVDQCTGMLYAAEKIVRENMNPGRTLDGSCNLLSALEACDECDDSRSRLSGDQSSEGESAIVGQDCPRLRPFKVGDVPIPMPANGRGITIRKQCAQAGA